MPDRRGGLVMPGSHVVRSAVSLVISTAASAVLGVVFWLLAARLFDSEVVGRDAAILAVMVELSAICQLNLDNALLRFLPGMRAKAGRAVVCAYLVNGAAAAVLGTAFVVAAPRISEHFDVLRGLGMALCFVGALALWGVFALQDAALVAMRRSPWVPVENVAFGVLKIAALPLALAVAAEDPVYLGWVIPMGIVVVPVNVMLFAVAVRRHRERDAVAPSALAAAGRRRQVGFLAQDYVGVVIGRAGIAVLPLVVVAVLGAAPNAWFSIPFAVITSFDMAIMSAATPIVAEGAYEQARLREHVSTVARRFGPPTLAAVLVLVVAAPIVLLPFGTEYADNGAAALRLLVLASVPRALVFLASAAWRVQGHGRRLLAAEAVALAVLAAMVVPLAHALELRGVALAWLIAWTLPGAAAGIWLVRFGAGSAHVPATGSADAP